MKIIHSTCVINGEPNLKEKLKKYKNLDNEQINKLKDGIIKELKKNKIKEET